MRELHGMTRIAVVAAVALMASVAVADTILDSGDPADIGGYWGFDICTMQDVGLAFTPSMDYTLDDISVWIMSNDFVNPGRVYTLSLYGNAEGGDYGMPDYNVIESWTVETEAVGWTPVLETVTSTLHPLLSAGEQYWILATSEEEGGEDPVWLVGDSEESFVMGIYDGHQEQWSSYYGGGAPAALVTATPVPEPAALTLLALVGLMMRRRRH